MKKLSPKAAEIMMRMLTEGPQRIEHQAIVDELSSFISVAAGRNRYKVVRHRVCEAWNAIDRSNER